jgi:hypothetical protein
MHDSELKKLLVETCPVRPGQESRAWQALQSRLGGAEVQRPAGWLFAPSWRALGLVALTLFLVPVVADLILISHKPVSIATADSQSPGIYATAFYSDSAQAQVVWLNGMDPATDKPTYLDPTTADAGSDNSAAPADDPNSL